MITSDLQLDTGSYVDKYPQFVEAVDFQKQDLFWSHHEIDLNKDKHDLRKKLNDAQRHAITFNQRLFTKYEDVIGNDYWIGVVHKKYKNQLPRFKQHISEQYRRDRTRSTKACPAHIILMF